MLIRSEARRKVEALREQDVSLLRAFVFSSPAPENREFPRL